MIQEGTKQYIPLSEFITEYSERNTENKYSPVAVGKYGIRSRESIYSKELASDYSKNKLIYKNTLTVGMGSKQIDVGVLIDDITYSVSPAYHTYKVTKINAKYLDYCIQCRNQDMFTRFVKRGSRQGKTVDLKRWLTYEIPVYDEKSQVEIVDHLNRVQSLIELRQKQLEKLDELIKARFVELFGNPIKNEKQWEILKLGDCLKRIDNGKSFTCDVQARKGEHPAILKLSAVTYGVYRPGENKALLDEKLFVDSAEVHSGDLLFTRKNTPELVGMAAYVYDTPDHLMMPDLIFRLVPNERMTAIFLWQLINNREFRPVIQSIAGGSAKSMSNISKERLSNISVICPPMDEQIRLNEIIYQVDKSKVIDTNIIPEGGFYYGDKFFIS